VTLTVSEVTGADTAKGVWSARHPEKRRAPAGLPGPYTDTESPPVHDRSCHAHMMTT
jgi:hypothetical protein